MKTFGSFLFAAFLCFLLFAACGSEKNIPQEYSPSLVEERGSSVPNIEISEDVSLTLERIAELERAGAFIPGMAFIESGQREGAGDFSGAVFAAYKELAWAYGYGGVAKADINDSMLRVQAVMNSIDIDNEADLKDLLNAAEAAVEGVLFFSEESWNQAAELLNRAVPLYEEPDSFFQWMLLVCALETGYTGVSNRSAYGAIRARYSNFPEYWYRGARAFGNELAGFYAEQCINLNPQGPYAPECRNIIASSLGIESGGEAMRSKAEIEDRIRRSVAESNPEILADLFPLMNLPDNDYTFYAQGALKALVSVPEFKGYFLDQARQHSGKAAFQRLGERLSYIVRG